MVMSAAVDFFYKQCRLCRQLKLKRRVVPPSPGDLCPRRLLNLQSASAAGGPGRRELLPSAAQPPRRSEAQKDAHKVEGDG